MKNNDTELYSMLVRTARMARRMPLATDTEGDAPRRCHGYGHILDILLPDESISQQQIASAIGIRPQSLSEALSLMEERGLVRREPSDRDRRVMLVSLTEKGVERREELSRQREYKARCFLSCLDEDEKKTLARLLCKLSENAKKEEADI